MHVGRSVIFQNPSQHIGDDEVYRNDLRMAGQVETLGFDSIRSVEHHSPRRKAAGWEEVR